MKKKTEAKEEVALRPGQLPSHVVKGKGRGFQEVERTDLLLPRIKLLQPLSPEVIERGMKAGHMINSLTKEDYGEEVTIIPILHFKNRIKWGPREEGGGIECSSDQGKLARPEYGVKNCLECNDQLWDNEAKKEEDRKPKCTLYYSFPCIVVESQFPVGLSMERTKVKTAKKLLSIARYSGPNLDLFAKKYRLYSVKEKGPKGQFFNFDVEPLGFTSEAEYKAAEVFYASLLGITVKIDVEEEVKE